MKRYIKWLLSILVLCSIIILIKNEYSYKLLENANYGMPALIEKGKVNNLYIGSSMFRQGIDIMTLEENEEDNYVLAYNGNQPVLEYFQLRNLVENSVQIENLYVDMYVYSAWAPPKISDEKMLMEFGLREKWNLFYLISNGTNSENIKTFWQMFVSGNNELLATWGISNKVINNIFYRGGSTNRPVASEKEKLDVLAIPQIDKTVNLVQLEYLKKLIQLAKDNKINIIFIESPKYDRMANNQEYICAMKQYINYLNEESIEYVLCDLTWNLTGQNAEVEKYLFDNSKSDYFVDNGHLSYLGRKEFTKQLINLQ